MLVNGTEVTGVIVGVRYRPAFSRTINFSIFLYFVTLQSKRTPNPQVYTAPPIL